MVVFILGAFGTRLLLFKLPTHVENHLCSSYLKKRSGFNLFEEACVRKKRGLNDRGRKGSAAYGFEYKFCTSIYFLFLKKSCITTVEVYFPEWNISSLVLEGSLKVLLVGFFLTFEFIFDPLLKH